MIPAVAGVKDDQVKLRAQLIWGTNDEKSPNPDHKDLNPELRKKLSGVFKWKNYFEVKNQEMAVPGKGTKRVRLSNQCEVEVKNLGSGMISAKLFGEGKLLVEQRQNFTLKEPLVLGGHDKNKTAWFVVLSPM
ncbi:MAG TPA: hypothetical protein VI454_00775 [Verrucomicrobiae bacterium]